MHSALRCSACVLLGFLLLHCSCASRLPPTPTPCCLVNGFAFKDVMDVSTQSGSHVVDAYQMTTYTIYNDGRLKEIRLGESLQSAQLLVLDTKQPSFRQVVNLELRNGVWCKESESSEYIANITLFELFRTGCNHGDASKFAGYDQAGNEKYLIENESSSAIERMTLHVARHGNRCNPSAFSYLYDKRDDEDGHSSTTSGFSVFERVNQVDYYFVNLLLNAKLCEA